MPQEAFQTRSVHVEHPHSKGAAALDAICGLIAGAVPTASPARAAAVFSDDFEQPTTNV